MVGNDLYQVICKIVMKVLSSVTEIFCVYQGLFRNYGSTFLPIFKAHIVELLADRSHEHHDSKQRCGMEILAGVIRGSKHWPYQEVCFVYFCFIISCTKFCVCGFFLSSSTNFNTVHFIEMGKMTVVCYSRAIEHRP